MIWKSFTVITQLNIILKYNKIVYLNFLVFKLFTVNFFNNSLTNSSNFSKKVIKSILKKLV